MSRDDGKTWSVARVLERGISACSDLALGKNRDFSCPYERGGVNDVLWDTKYVTLARQTLEWFEEADRACYMLVFARGAGLR